MKYISRRLFASAILAGAALSAGVAAKAQTIITSLPYTITAGGTYILTSNLGSTATSGNLITINASNVTIDFQNHFITGPAASLSSTSPVGIYAYERSNLNIRNGTIAYCSYGTKITGNSTTTTNNVDQQITNMRATYCATIGIDIEHAPASVIDSCQVSQIGLSTASFATGINVDGAGVVVRGCTVSNITCSGNDSHGIYSDNGSFTRQCQVSSSYSGVTLGIYQDNLASTVTSAFSGGTDAGGNTDDGAPYISSFAGVRPSAKPRQY